MQNIGSTELAFDHIHTVAKQFRSWEGGSELASPAIREEFFNYIKVEAEKALQEFKDQFELSRTNHRRARTAPGGRSNSSQRTT